MTCKKKKLFKVLGYNVAVAPIVEGFDSLDPQVSITLLLKFKIQIQL